MTQPNFLNKNPGKKVDGVAAILTVLLVVGLVVGAWALEVWFIMLIAGAVHSAFKTDILNVPWSFGQAFVASLVFNLIGGIFKKGSSD